MRPQLAGDLSYSGLTAKAAEGFFDCVAAVPGNGTMTKEGRHSAQNDASRGIGDGVAPSARLKPCLTDVAAMNDATIGLLVGIEAN